MSRLSQRALRPGAIALLLLAAPPVLDAGGWAVVTVGKMPDTVVVGQPVTLTYAVRQHGQRLLSGLNGRIEARFGGARITATAARLPEEGHYTATFTLPSAGTWTVDIHSGFDNRPGRVALHAIEPGTVVAAPSPAERGQGLFVSKGCVTCHLEGMSGAPTLEASGYEPGYLTRFLTRPPQPEGNEWRMPDLRLDQAEVASLVAFLNARRPTAASTR